MTHKIQRLKIDYMCNILVHMGPLSGDDISYGVHPLWMTTSSSFQVEETMC